MELKDLVGEHILSGVDMINRLIILDESDRHENSQVVNFVLDGKTYTAIEDPQDGYRSCMREIVESNEAVSNVFAGQQVIARMADDINGMANEILQLIDLQTNKVVLAVGTAGTNDYYPYWIAEFSPENMAINNV